MTGVLLINLGTPDAANKAAVKIYLRQFLNDPRVVDLPYLARKILVNLIIIPLRTRRSTHAYQQIWTKAGSPLLIYSQKLQQALAVKLGEHYQVALGMRYGNPSIASAYQQLQACDSIIVLPLFPQYSSAATGSALENVFKILAQQWHIPPLTMINHFYNDAGFIASYAQLVQTAINAVTPDLVILSYHGLPERHLHKSHCQAVCDRQKSCPAIIGINRDCYRAQCYATSALLANALQLQPSQYITTFQSRLGKAAWIKPYTDVMLPQLIQQGMKNIVIACPSFVADCLETIEEIGITIRARWQALGGEKFELVPCLNAHPEWVTALAALLKQQNHSE